VFGNAVAVPASDLWFIAAVAVVCAVLHVAFAKELAFTSFDGETAQAVGMNVRLWDAVLFLTIGLAIPATARALGALPVFAFLTLPAAGALAFGAGFRRAFVLAAALGVVAAGGGYVISWLAEIPTGATMVALAAILAAPAAFRGAR